MGNPSFDFGLQAIADVWVNTSRRVLQAQFEAGRDFLASLNSRPGGAPGGPASPAGNGAAQPSDVAQAVGAISQFWQTAASLSATLTSALAQAGQTADPTVDTTFRAMTDPRSWLQNLGGMDAALGRVTEGAQLADLWNTERQQARLLRAWLDVRQRTLEHHAVVLDAWLRAGGQFAAELPAHLRTTAGVTPDVRALLALWTQTANRVLLETQRSEPFLRTQAAMVRAGTALRLVQTELAERWAEQFNLPTRTELDDVHRTLTELRREVRAMQRAANERTAASVAHGT